MTHYFAVRIRMNAAGEPERLQVRVLRTPLDELGERQATALGPEQDLHASDVANLIAAGDRVYAAFRDERLGSWIAGDELCAVSGRTFETVETRDVEGRTTGDHTRLARY